MLETDTMGSVVSIRLSVDPDQRGFASPPMRSNRGFWRCPVPTDFAWSTGTGWMSVSPIIGTLTRFVICHLPCHSNVQPPICLLRREPSCQSKRLSRMIWLFGRLTFISRGVCRTEEVPADREQETLPLWEGPARHGSRICSRWVGE